MKNVIILSLRVVAVSLLLITCIDSFAQNLVDSLRQDDINIISSIAPYSADMRSAILEVSQYPQALIKLERTQGRTSQSFQDLIAKYPREDQEKFYQAGRFPELINQLVAGEKKTDAALKTMLNDYPENIQQQITSLYLNHYDDLVKVNDIYRSSQAALEKITAGYSPSVQDDFKKVIGSPDVMNLLTDNIDLTVSLGDAYKNDPAAITKQLDDLNKQLSVRSEKDLAQYKSAVEKDPALQAEMKKAADEFAQQYDQGTSPTIVTNNYYDNSPYQYWYGYPYWYSTPMWYPTPFYYQTGFYYGAGGALVIAGLPSAFYANWFFHHGYSHYPTLYKHYNTYYNVHRTEILNHNVYRGFNGAVHNHYANIGRSPSIHPSVRPNTGIGMNHGMYHENVHQLTVKPGNFNNNGFNHYNAGSFHNSGWQHVRSMSSGMHGRGR